MSQDGPSFAKGYIGRLDLPGGGSKVWFRPIIFGQVGIVVDLYVDNISDRDFDLSFDLAYSNISCSLPLSRKAFKIMAGC